VDSDNGPRGLRLLGAVLARVELDRLDAVASLVLVVDDHRRLDRVVVDGAAVARDDAPRQLVFEQLSPVR
jgi:hypothetical protein